MTTVPSRTVFAVLLGLVLLSGLPAYASAEGTREKPAEDPVDVDLKERVQVNLAEVRILVTDKRGNPVTDLTRDEIHVFEDGVERKIAFLENVTGIRDEAPFPIKEVKVDAPEKVAEPDQPEAEPEIAMLPPKAVRRIVFAFDVSNSKRNVRKRWQQSALFWIKYDMRPEDQVGVVIFRSYPEWLVHFTSDQEEIYRVLQQEGLLDGVPDRDRSRDMNALVADIHSLCSDPMGNSYNQDGRQGGKKSVDEFSCSYNIAEGYVQQWYVDSSQTVEVLRSLTGQLAAIPGRKSVILYSDGFLTDAATLGANAMIAVFGSGKIDQRMLTTRMDRNVVRQLDKLHSVSRDARVSFFTMDTKRGSDAGFSGQMEIGTTLAYDNMGLNPWSEMRWENRGTLSALAKESGGRSFRGVKDLEEMVTSAADSFFGSYLLGYYRVSSGSVVGKVKVKIDRKKMKISYSDRPTLWPHRPSLVTLDLKLGKPDLAGQGGEQIIPLALSMEMSALPLRRGDGGRGAQLGVFVQATRPDGTVVAEIMEVATVVMDRQQWLDAKGKLYRHFTSLSLPVGAYRLHARISDDRQEIIAQRFLNVEVIMGEVRPLSNITAAAE